MSNILEVDNLSKNFKDFALQNISFSLPKGFIMGFICPNGAGKSTTIKLIMNLLQRDSGTIKVFGLDNLKQERNIKDRLGFVYDENYFYEELTIKEMASGALVLREYYLLLQVLMPKIGYRGHQPSRDVSNGMKPISARYLALPGRTNQRPKMMIPIIKRMILSGLPSLAFIRKFLLA